MNACSIVLSSVGSWGDIFPLIPVAHELRRRGHSITFALGPYYENFIRGEGFAFYSLAAEFDLDPKAWEAVFAIGINDRSRRMQIGSNLLKPLDGILERLGGICAEADLLVATNTQLAAPIIAETSAIPWITISVNGGTLPTKEQPPNWPVLHLPSPLASVGNRFSWSFDRWELRTLDRDINRRRRQLGLATTKDILHSGAFSPALSLILMSERYWPRPGDWPPQVKLVGFSQWDRPERWQEPPELEPFLSQGGPPVVFTLGTSTANHPEDFYKLALEACRNAGRRAVLLLGGVSGRDIWERAATSSGVLSAEFAAWPYVPLSRLLPHCSALVHVGGIGATIAAVEAGIPSLIVPRLHDQGFHARRVTELGIGRRLSWSRLSSANLRREIDLILGDATYVEKSRALAAKLATENGPARAADEIEAFLASRVAS